MDIGRLFDRWLSHFYIWRIWGPRCSEYEPGCGTCERWKEHDWLFDLEKPHPTDG